MVVKRAAADPPKPYDGCLLGFLKPFLDYLILFPISSPCLLQFSFFFVLSFYLHEAKTAMMKMNVKMMLHMNQGQREMMLIHSNWMRTFFR